MKTRFKIILILVSIMINHGFVYGQDPAFSKNSIKIGLGVGSSMGNKTDGGGFVYAVGYQREIWKDRLRLNPNFTIGHYSSKFILDVRDQYFNSINIETNLYYDLIRIKSFSLVLGFGGLVNNSRGLKGTGGDPDGYTEPPTSEYISDFHFAGYLGGGLRINPPSKRIAINIMPINLHFGNNYFAEFHAKIELDFKF
ncbi:MAG: hypothetical protein ACOX32_01240 [Bacteroidaceae bacterium]|jgi:hypothetical protein